MVERTYRNKGVHLRRVEQRCVWLRCTPLGSRIVGCRRPQGLVYLIFGSVDQVELAILFGSREGEEEGGGFGRTRERLPSMSCPSSFTVHLLDKRHQLGQAVDEFIAAPTQMIVNAELATLCVLLEHRAAAFVVVEPERCGRVAVAEIDDDAPIPLCDRRRMHDQGLNVLYRVGERIQLTHVVGQ